MGSALGSAGSGSDPLAAVYANVNRNFSPGDASLLSPWGLQQQQQAAAAAQQQAAAAAEEKVKIGVGGISALDERAQYPPQVLTCPFEAFNPCLMPPIIPCMLASMQLPGILMGFARHGTEWARVCDLSGCEKSCRWFLPAAGWEVRKYLFTKHSISSCGAMCAQVRVRSPIKMDSGPGAAPGASAAPPPADMTMDGAAAKTGIKDDATESPIAAGTALQGLLGGSLADNLAAVEDSMRADAAEGLLPPLAGLCLAHDNAPAAPATMAGFPAGLMSSSDPTWGGPVPGIAPGAPASIQG